MLISFNTNDVSKELDLVHSVLRLYQNPLLGRYYNTEPKRTSISIFHKIYNWKQQARFFKIVATINSTTTYKGWLEFNVTRLLSKWLQYRSLESVIHGNDILISTTLNSKSGIANVLPSDLGIITAYTTVHEDLKPFIIGYFNGPELITKVQKLRFKRNVIKRKHTGYPQNPPLLAEEYKQPETCQRINFTLDFRDLDLHKTIIAPKEFEAYFCGGGCNFPLGSKMNATNHAIVQTLMHLRHPSLPRACCVPTKLGSISILHYLNEDSVTLRKYQQSVAKECGCH